MKKYLLTIFLMVSYTIIAQNKPKNDVIPEAISIEPTQVSASVIFKLEFDAPSEITYKIFKGTKLVSEERINKKSGVDVRKVDFSALPQGNYILKFFRAQTEIKEILFSKI